METAKKSVPQHSPLGKSASWQGSSLESPDPRSPDPDQLSEDQGRRPISSLGVRGQRLERLRRLECTGHITDTIRAVDDIELLDLGTFAEVQLVQLDPDDIRAGRGLEVVDAIRQVRNGSPDRLRRVRFIGF